MSGLFVGVVVDHSGYSAAFFDLAAAAAIAWTTFVVFMPEIRNDGAVERERDAIAALQEPAGDGM